MARCPRCTRHFRTLEDEEGMHDCPHCGYWPGDEPTCDWCNGEFNEYDQNVFWPYCSEDCSQQAERDSEEDN